MKFSIIIKKLKRNYYDYGFLITLKKSILYLFKIIYENKVYRIYRVELHNYEEQVLINSDLQYKLINVNESNIIKQVEGMEEWLHGKLRAKLEANCICMIALDGEKVAGFNLVSFNDIFMPLINLHKTFKDGVAWSEQIYVHKNYRKKGIGSSLRYRIFNELNNRGIRTFYGGSLLPNKENLNLARKVGFKEIIDIHYRKTINNKRWNYRRIR